jgi:6-phosphogluconolactonase
MEAAVKSTCRPDIRVFPDKESMSRAAAEFLSNRAQRSIGFRGSCSLALSGGSTPVPLYRVLASPAYLDRIPWGKMDIFWADERCVPPDHPESNYKLIFDTLLSIVPVPASKIHRIRGEEGPEHAAQAYEEDLFIFFGRVSLPTFDLVILGAGEDGHTASLFPESVLLHERKRLALPVHLAPYRTDRVTLSLPVLNNATDALILVTGGSKASVVHEIMEDGNPKRYPAGLISPMRGKVTWMLDHDAAQALTHVQR